jgi:hypothetical protein
MDSVERALEHAKKAVELLEQRATGRARLELLAAIAELDKK